MKKIFLASLVLVFLITGFFSVKTVYAADPSCEDQCKGLMQVGPSGKRDIAGESYKCCTTTCANKSTDFGLCIGIDNPLGQKKDVKDILASIITTVIQIVLPIVVLMVIYSGFLYVLARGKPEAIETAHKTLTWTLVGAAILLGAQLIANVLIDTISSIGDDSGYNSKKTIINTDGSCYDGIQNGTETGIDTGGRCTTGGGSTGTCMDGIKNGDETGIDTGGRCAVDTGTCTDKVKNGDETGIDTGGRCATTNATITNLTFNLESETADSATGKFSYFVSNDFTPDLIAGKSTLELFCPNSGSGYALDPFNPEPGSTKLTSGTHKTTASYTIKNKGDNICKISYMVGNVSKESSTGVIKIPSTGSGVDPKTELSYITNLKAAVDESKETYDGTKLYSPVKFTYDVSQDFTPDAGTYMLTCLPNSEINKTFPSTSMNIQLFSDPKKADLVKKTNGYVIFDATSTALYIKDTHKCTISYKLSGNLKSTSVDIKVPAKTYGNNSGNSLSDPISGTSFKVDNNVGVEIKKIDVANNSVDYEVIVYDYKDFINLGMTCVNKNNPTTFISDNFTSTVKRDGNSTLRAIFAKDALKGMTLTDVYCAVEFTLNSDNVYHSTYAFPLVVGNGNNKKYLGY